MNELLKQIISEVCYIGVTAIGGIITYYIRKFIVNHTDYIEKQKELVKQQLGDAQYEADKAKAKEIIYAVEQMSKEFDWESEIKHSKAVEKITAVTGLSSGDIFDIIKATVAEMNLNKTK